MGKKKFHNDFKPVEKVEEKKIEIKTMVEQDKDYDIACEISDDAFLSNPPLNYRRDNGSVDKHKVRLLVKSVENGSIYFTGAYHEKRKSDYLRFLKSL